MAPSLINQSSTHITSTIFRTAQIYAPVVAKPVFGIPKIAKSVSALLERVVNAEAREGQSLSEAEINGW
jgi:hypothetical protein